MTHLDRPFTGDVNGPLWGRGAADWSQLLEPQFRPLYEAAFDRLGMVVGHDYLDVGCGAGLALQVAKRRGARITGLDASAALLAVARERVPDADLRQTDLQQLPFAAHAFDRVSGFNAFQYAADPAAALAEAGRVCRPGGGILIATWGPPDRMEAASLIAALKPLLPPAPPGAPGPFALSDEPTLRNLAQSAGLAPGDCFDVATRWSFDTLELACRALKSAGVAARAVDHSGEAAVDAAHAAAWAPFRQSDRGYAATAIFRCLIAAPRRD
ncbi:MAG TPA: class I SAM-dependent methyltransferase [Burkholderiaceae bacterium]|nr:class I SAM-dependent methyltransferase [Burkholderiaceae bacterium]